MQKNILDTPKNRSTFILSGAGETGTLKSKAEMFKWRKLGDCGEFSMIDKSELNLDERYQREPSQKKVNDMAREFNWESFGVISAILREDGSFWIFDGGHRVAAALKRSDIDRLPCMVFMSTDLSAEAQAFFDTNGKKSEVPSQTKYKAGLVAKDECCLIADRILKSHGYAVRQTSSGGCYGFAAISTLLQIIKKDRDSAALVFDFLCRIGSGESFSSNLLKGMFLCHQRLSDEFLNGDNLNRLAPFGIDGLEAAIKKETMIAGVGGERVAAKALLNIVNGRRRNKLTLD